VRKLIGTGLLLLAGCRSAATTTTTSTTPAPGSTTSTSPATPVAPGVGAASATDALAAMMAAVKAEDLQAFGAVWGTKDGPAREQWSRSEFEMRAYYNMKCLRNDSYSILSTENPVGGGKVMITQIKKGQVVAVTKFTAVPTSSGRWFVSNFDAIPLTKICQAA
jgi:hypothetical protein